MKQISSYILPEYSPEIQDDSLFHYTSADGFVGIINGGAIWLTASYCSNDESELESGEELLTRTFSNFVQDLIDADDPLVRTFSSRGVNIHTYAQGFKEQIIGLIFSQFSSYIACFCKPAGKADFHSGILSQWRAYGADGGYAIQFSKRKLLNVIDVANKKLSSNYDLQEVNYSPENPLKVELMGHLDAFNRAFRADLDELAKPIVFAKDAIIPNPLGKLTGGPLESLIDYLMYTKNCHFNEEREYRLSLIELDSLVTEKHSTNYFTRNGLIVPYKKTCSEAFQLIDCVEGVIVGPSSRMGARVESARQLLKMKGLRIPVRPSQIPFTRL